MLITTSSAQLEDALSLWTVLVLGLPMDHAPILLATTRTEDADTTRSAQTLLTMDMVVHMPTSTSSAPPVVVLSLWTVLVLGLPMDLVSMMKRIMKMRDADCTKSLKLLRTMDMPVPMPMEKSIAPNQVVVSPLTVKENGEATVLVSTMQANIRTKDARRIRLPQYLQPMVKLALIPTT